MIIDSSTITANENYKMLISTIIPRPIALVSTKGRDGSINLAPFSFFNGVTSDPPILSLAIGKKRGGIDKDTLRNIKETEEFIVHIVTEAVRESMNITSDAYEYDVNEFEKAGLTMEPAEYVDVPKVKECPIALECVLYKIIEVGNIPMSLVLGEIKSYHIPDDCIDHCSVDESKIEPVARLGKQNYLHCYKEQMFEMLSPAYKRKMKKAK